MRVRVPRIYSPYASSSTKRSEPSRSRRWLTLPDSRTGMGIEPPCDAVARLLISHDSRCSSTRGLRTGGEEAWSLGRDHCSFANRTIRVGTKGWSRIVETVRFICEHGNPREPGLATRFDAKFDTVPQKTEVPLRDR